MAKVSSLACVPGDGKCRRHAKCSEANTPPSAPTVSESPLCMQHTGMLDMQSAADFQMLSGTTAAKQQPSRLLLTALQSPWVC